MKRIFDEAFKDVASFKTINPSYMNAAFTLAEFCMGRKTYDHHDDYGDPQLNCLPLLKIVELNSKLDFYQRLAVKSMGFGGLLELKCTMLRRSLCKWIIDGFDPLSKIWEADGCKIPIKASDMEQILGLSSQGLPVPVQGPDEDIADLCQQFEEFDSYISLETVGEKIKACRSAGKEFQMMYCIFVIGYLMSPMTDFTVKKEVLHAVKNIDAISVYNWAQYVLDGFSHGVQRAKSLKHEYLNGCMLCLMILFFERVKHFHLFLPKPVKDLVDNPTLFGPEPHIKFWTNEAVDEYRDVYVLENGKLCFSLAEEDPDPLDLWKASDHALKIAKGDSSPGGEVFRMMAFQSNALFEGFARHISLRLLSTPGDFCFYTALIKTSHFCIMRMHVVDLFVRRKLSRCIIDTLSAQMANDCKKSDPFTSYFPSVTAFTDYGRSYMPGPDEIPPPISAYSEGEFYFPINYERDDWFLVIVNFEDREVVVCDPLRGRPARDVNSRVLKLLRMLDEAFKDGDGNILNLTTFSYVNEDWVPRLVHAEDSGMFVCMMMQGGRDEAAEVDGQGRYSQSQRFKLISRMWLHWSNEARDGYALLPEARDGYALPLGALDSNF